MNRTVWLNLYSYAVTPPVIPLGEVCPRCLRVGSPDQSVVCERCHNDDLTASVGDRPKPTAADDDTPDQQAPGYYARAHHGMRERPDRRWYRKWGASGD